MTITQHEIILLRQHKFFHFEKSTKIWIAFQGYRKLKYLLLESSTPKFWLKEKNWIITNSNHLSKIFLYWGVDSIPIPISHIFEGVQDVFIETKSQGLNWWSTQWALNGLNCYCGNLVLFSSYLLPVFQNSLSILSSTEVLVTFFMPERRDEDVKLLTNILWFSSMDSATGF